MKPFQRVSITLTLSDPLQPKSMKAQESNAELIKHRHA